jgi:hypothetical protein
MAQIKCRICDIELSEYEGYDSIMECLKCRNLYLVEIKLRQYSR